MAPRMSENKYGFVYRDGTPLSADMAKPMRSDHFCIMSALVERIEKWSKKHHGKHVREILDENKRLIEEVYQPRLREVVFDYSEVDYEKAAWGLNGIYQFYNMRQEKIYFVDSPAAGYRLINEHNSKMPNPASEADLSAKDPYVNGKLELPCVYLMEMFRKDLGCPGLDDLEYVTALCENSGWTWFYFEAGYISGWITKMNVDPSMAPHCEEGPIFEYADGTGQYALDATIVPKKLVVAPETITPEEFHREESADVRSMMIERAGETLFNALEPKLVDADTRSSDGGSMRGLFQTERDGLILVGHDGSSKRVFYMPVPDGVRTCQEAHEAICGFNEDLIHGEG